MDVFRALKKVYKIDPRSPTREIKAVWARRAMYVYLRTSDKLITLDELGDIFKQHHTTVLHSISAHYDLYGRDKDYTKLFNEFRVTVNIDWDNIHLLSDEDLAHEVNELELTIINLSNSKELVEKEILKRQQQNGNTH